MKLRKILPNFIALLALSVIISSCLNDDNLIPPNCNDGILNNGEFDVDCGGEFCEACPPSCTNGLWDPDFGEIDIDCGGPCEVCPTCNDGIINQDELGIDCGGENCVPCSTVGSCINGILDGEETGIDCGSPDCNPCAEAACDDGIQNGDEEGIDCGGSFCPSCNPASCDDGALNGEETGIDCGDLLNTCPPCQTAAQGQIIFRANNSPFEVYSGATATGEGDLLITLTMLGSGGTDEQITFLVPNAQDLLPGNTIDFNQTTATAGYIIGLEYGVFGNFLTNTVSSSVSVTFDEISAMPGSTISGTFSGEIYNSIETFSINLTEGSFNLILQ